MPVEYRSVNGENFLLFNTEGETIIYAFATEEFLKILCECDKIYMDGTYAAAPNLFMQLYTIHGFYKEQMLPLIYVLLPNKKAKTYQIMLNLIVAESKRRNLTFQPKEIQIDFEQAVVRAIRSVLPKTSVKGSFFHYTQSIWRNVKKNGLSGKKYVKNIKKIVRLIMYLPLIKKHHMPQTWQKIKNLINIENNEKLLQVKKYFEHTWFSSNSIFSLNMWNHFNNLNRKTNNHLEGWHNKINRNLTEKHPNIYKLLNIIKTEQSASINKIKLSENVCVSPKTKRNVIWRNNYISKCNQEYTIGKINSMQFLSNVSKILQN